METLRFSNHRININTGYKIIQYSNAQFSMENLKKFFIRPIRVLKSIDAMRTL